MAPSGGPLARPQQVRQFAGAVGDPERRSIRFQGHPGFERTGVDSVESESIDELEHLDDRSTVIACGGDGHAIWRARRTPAFFELVVAELVETLHHSRRRKPRLDDNARTGR